MKRMGKNIASLGIALLLLSNFAITHAQALTQETKEQLDKIGEIMAKAALAGDYQALVKYYADDAVVMPDFQPALHGKEALSAHYEKNIEEGARIHSVTGTVAERWRCGEEIFERGTFGVAGSSYKSPQPVAYYGSYFRIWQEESKGIYKIKLAIWNLDFNPFEKRE